MRTLFGLVLVAVVAMEPVAAQATLTADVAVNSQYQWRGLTTTNRPVVQPDVILTLVRPAFTLTLGAWGSIEGGRYDDAQFHISQNGGAGIALSEYDAWVEATRTVGAVTLTGGVAAYKFPNETGTTAVANTSEIYLKTAIAGPLSPGLAIWHDVRRIAGTYAEVSVAQVVSRFRLSATSGWNIGQSVGDGGDLGYFTRAGFTHADIAVLTSWTMNGVTVAPSLHLLLGNDPSTQVAAPGRNRDAKIWFGTMLSWSRRIGRLASGHDPAAATEGTR